MANDIADRRRAFLQLHKNGCFLLPNPWDIGSAKRLETLGFKAIASSSAAAAWALGKSDYAITVDEALVHLEMLVRATALPVNADFENGFSDDPDIIATNVAAAVDVGVAGLSIEDRSGDGLREEAHAVDCIRSAKAACEDALLVARCEAYLVGRHDADDTIRRLVAYADAGADCLYAPGVADMTVIREIVNAVAPKPVNVLLWPGLEPRALADVGVRRISVGGSLAHAAWAAFDEAAAALRTSLD